MGGGRTHAAQVQTKRTKPCRNLTLPFWIFLFSFVLSCRALSDGDLIRYLWVFVCLGSRWKLGLLQLWASTGKRCRCASLQSLIQLRWNHLRSWQVHTKCNCCKKVSDLVNSLNGELLEWQATWSGHLKLTVMPTWRSSRSRNCPGRFCLEPANEQRALSSWLGASRLNQETCKYIIVVMC